MDKPFPILYIHVEMVVLIGILLYDTKFRREKILANLANYKGFAKIFLSKIFSFDLLVVRNMCKLAWIKYLVKVY